MARDASLAHREHSRIDRASRLSSQASVAGTPEAHRLAAKGHRDAAAAARAMGHSRLSSNHDSLAQHHEAMAQTVRENPTAKIVFSHRSAYDRGIMAKHSKALVAKAESWYGVSHNVPRRGTEAHKRMVSKYLRHHPHARLNPTPKPVFVAYRYAGYFIVTLPDGRIIGSLRPAEFIRIRKLGGVAYGGLWIDQPQHADNKRRDEDLHAYNVRYSRGNPIKTRQGRVLRPENCNAEVTQQLMHSRHGKRKRVRVGKCDYRSASYALARHAGSGGGSAGSRILPWWPTSK